MSKTEQIEVASEVVDADPREILKQQANADWKTPHAREQMFKLTVNKLDGDPSDEMFVSVNFKPYQIKYGMEVEVPKSVVDALKNTNIMTMTQDPESKRRTPVTKPRFAFSAEPV